MEFIRQAGRWAHALTDDGAILCSGAFVPDPKKGWMLLHDPGSDLCSRCRLLIAKRERAQRIQQNREVFAGQAEQTILALFEQPGEFTLITARQSGKYKSMCVTSAGTSTRSWPNERAAVLGHAHALGLLIAERAN
jgi:hypothetical protein